MPTLNTFLSGSGVFPELPPPLHPTNNKTARTTVKILLKLIMIPPCFKNKTVHAITYGHFEQA
jgi:hypothetical protein